MLTCITLECCCNELLGDADDMKLKYIRFFPLTHAFLLFTCYIYDTFYRHSLLSALIQKFSVLNIYPTAANIFFVLNDYANCSLPMQSVHNEHTVSAKYFLSMYVLVFLQHKLQGRKHE